MQAVAASNESKRGIVARAGMSAGILLYGVGFFVLFVAQMKVVGAIMFFGGILLAVVGLFAQDMADDRERDERKLIASAAPPRQRPCPSFSHGSWEE